MNTDTPITDALDCDPQNLDRTNVNSYLRMYHHAQNLERQLAEARKGWQPIETAPKDGKVRIMIASIHDGEIKDIDFDAVLEQEQESWEIPQTYWVWKSAYGRVEEPTHWMPLPEPPTP